MKLTCKADIPLKNLPFSVPDFVLTPATPDWKHLQKMKKFLKDFFSGSRSEHNHPEDAPIEEWTKENFVNYLVSREFSDSVVECK